MKWIKIISGTLAGIVVLAALGLWLAGFRAGANTIRESIEIAKAPDQVWPWLHEPEKLKAWVSWLLEIQPPDATSDAVGVRSTWIMEDRNNNNARMPIHNEVTASERPRRKVIRTTSPEGFDGEITYSLTDLGNGRTRLDMENRYVFAHWFARLLEPVITPAARRKSVEDLQRLKSLAEK
jgi:uncharacterized protein YndB with AHSA1/START domain